MFLHAAYFWAFPSGFLYFCIFTAKNNTMNLILFDDHRVDDLLPLTFYRPAAMLLTGILTTARRWEILTGLQAKYSTRAYLQPKFPFQSKDDNLLINGRLVANEAMVSRINHLPPGEALRTHETLLAARTTAVVGAINDLLTEQMEKATEISDEIPILIQNPWDLFTGNDKSIAFDFNLLTKGRKSHPISKTNTVIGPHPVFLEKGVKMECAILNTFNGPVYLAENSEVMEGTVIRGPFALGEGSVVKMLAKIYGPVTTGPYCKIGGEINNSVFLGYSNKAHDGFLGQAVIGEWCNLGADTNNSNLKNTYETVKMWSYTQQRFVKTGLRFCGLIMGDHSKCGINTMFNTGTVVGVNCNVFGAGYQRNLIPSFSWGGGHHPFSHFNLEKSFIVADTVFKRRNLLFSETDKSIMNAIYLWCKEKANY